MGFITKLFGGKTETVDAVANDIVETAMTCGQVFVSNMAKDDNGKETSNSASNALAANEFFYFFIHFVSRLAYALGDDARTKKVVDGIFYHSLNKFESSVAGAARESIVSVLEEGMAEAEKEYAGCKLEAKEGEGLKGTLFWEVSKRISIAAGGGRDIANIVVATEVVTKALSALKLEKRVKALAGT